MSGLLEDLVATRVLYFKGQFAIGGSLVVRAVKRQGAHVEGLAGLIDGLLGSEENGDFVFQPHLLSEFRGPDRRVDEIVHRITSDYAGGKVELRFGSATAIQASREKRAGFLIGNGQVDADGTGAGDGIVLRIGDHHPHGCSATRQVRLLAQDMHHRRAQDLRYGFRVLDRCGLAIVIGKAIAQTLPYQVIRADRFRQGQLFLPRALALAHIHVMLRTSQDVVLGIEHFDGQLTRPGMRRAIGDAGMQGAVRVGGDGRLAGRCL